MGDCLMRIFVANEVLLRRSDNGDLPQSPWVVVSRTFSADTTVREVVDEALQSLWNPEHAPGSRVFPDDVCLWDCTWHPPKDITDWPLTVYCDKVGPHSKTLYDAGWFPSGTWQVLPKGTTPTVSTQQLYEDAQYNLPAVTETMPLLTSVVSVRDHDSATPSQILQSVTERFAHHDDELIDEDTKVLQALEVRRQRQLERKTKENERHAKLEQRIRQLGSSKKKVSHQVRNMLIKSRCTGSSSLKVQDRIYLHAVVIVEGEDVTKEQYRYFSQQDTVARVMSAMVATPRISPQETELLVQVSGESENDPIYRRLPISMRLYEAISRKCLNEVDSVVIRCYTPPNDEPTTSILEQELDITETVHDQNTNTTTATTEQNDHMIDTLMDAARECSTCPGTQNDAVYNRLNEAIARMDEGIASKAPKKKSSTSEKVRTMLIKSRAKGDERRVPKMEHRFFLELVIAVDEGVSCTASVSCVFLARTDMVVRLVRDSVTVPKDHRAEILIPRVSNGYGKVPDDISLQDAESQGILKCFDRVIIRLYKE